MRPSTPSLSLSRMALASIVGAFMVTAACQSAAADEVWNTNVGTIFYQRDIGRWAIWRFGAPRRRGEIYVKGLGGVYRGRGSYRGYWIESKSQWAQRHDKLCHSAMKGVDGLASRYWGYINVRFIDPQFPSRWIAKAGYCRGPLKTIIKAKPRIGR